MHSITAHKLDQDQDLLTELRILSSLRPHDRISTNNSTKPVIRIQKPSVLQPVLRFFGSESRISNITYIQSLLQRIIDRHTFAVQVQDNELSKRLKTETHSAIMGIRRLQHTYEEDAQFQAAMNISVDTVCIHLDIQPREMQSMSRQKDRFVTTSNVNGDTCGKDHRLDDENQEDSDSDSDEKCF